eukprot:s1892_g3.t1
MLPRNIDDPNHASQLMRLEHKVEEMRIEMQKAQMAEQRLRIDRDEWRLMAENLQAPGDDDAEGGEDDNHDEDIFHDVHDGDPDPEPDDDDDPGDSPSRRNRRGPGYDPPDGDDPDGGDDPEYTEVKISRREADKGVVPPFPTVSHLESWMSQCIANVLSACADPNQEEWMKWLSPALRPHPDVEALNDSGHKKFKGIDVKLGVAMSAMLRAGSDKAAELYLEVNRKASDYVRSYDGKIIKGRQIIAMMYESFRTRDRLDMIVSLDYLVKLQFQGDNKLHQFKQSIICDQKTNGDKCPLSHSKRLLRHQLVRERHQVCSTFNRTGSCSRENCPFKHEAAPATPAAKAEAKAKAKAEAKAKSEPSAAAKKTAKSKAMPAAPAIRMCRAWNPSAPAIWKRSSYIADDESECSSIDSDVDSDCSTSPTKSPKRRQVSFAKDVRFQPTKPRRSYKERDHEVVKVDVAAMVNDANRATELEFAKHKAITKWSKSTWQQW